MHSRDFLLRTLRRSSVKVVQSLRLSRAYRGLFAETRRDPNVKVFLWNIRGKRCSAVCSCTLRFVRLHMGMKESQTALKKTKEMKVRFTLEELFERSNKNFLGC